MRTMNKIVALALVLAMAFSMMASAASFKDQATINEDLIDEIDLMVALNVFSAEGTGTGNFEPNVELTRAMAAKLVYVLKNKGNDNGAASWTGMDIFKDVEAGSWYEGYVNYCASVGMIAGTGEGMFNPNGKVTGVEFAKLLLVLIGYKADVEGYTGAQWFENIVEDAEIAGLFVDYELPVRAAVTREWAAKLMHNAIYATKVQYFLGERIDANTTFAAADLNLRTVNAIALGTTKFVLNTTGAPTTDKDGVKSTIEIDGTPETIKYEIPASLLGQKVKVVYKADKAIDEAKIYGVVAHEDSAIYEVASDKIVVGTGSYNGKVKIAGLKNNEYVNDHAVKVYNNMHYLGTFNVSALKQNTNAVIKFVNNDTDTDVEYAFVTIPVIGTVNEHKAADKKLTITANYAHDNIALTKDSTGFTYENVKFMDEIVKNDIVAGIYDYSTGVKTLVLEKVEPFTATVSQVNTNSSSAVVSNVINGTTYKVAYNALTGTALKTVAGSTEYKFYVHNGYIVATENITVIPSNIALVLAVQNGANLTPAKAKVMLSDGTIATYDYKNVTGWTNLTNATIEGVIAPDTVMEYKLTDGQISLKALSNVGGMTYTTDVSESDYNKNTMTYTVDSNTLVKVADDAFFFLKKGTNKYSVVKGSEIQVAAAGTIKMTAYNNETIKKAVFGFIEATTIDEASAATYAFITGNAYSQDDNGTTIWFVKGRDKNGAEITFQVSKVGSNAATKENINALYNGIVTYTILDGKAELTAVANASGIGTGYTAGSISAIEGDTVVIGGNLYTIADDAVIINVKVNDSNKPVWQDTTNVVAAVSSANNVVYKTKGTSGANASIISEIIVEVNGAAIQY
ncbi:MAG: S-layer homology domain-containing protein [Clostridia bacterium]|nr:S-layer homology domain-containing protein [Clostridia bacterium]